jgi:hypothetical protein
VFHQQSLEKSTSDLTASKRFPKKVEDIPNFGPDLWTMREGDKKCQQIQQDAQCIRKQLSNYVGTGHS